MLVKHGADINSTDDWGNSPISEAAKNGELICIYFFWQLQFSD